MCDALIFRRIPLPRFRALHPIVLGDCDTRIVARAGPDHAHSSARKTSLQGSFTNKRIGFFGKRMIAPQHDFVTNHLQLME
jgi:hypothetical protein